MHSRAMGISLAEMLDHHQVTGTLVNLIEKETAAIGRYRQAQRQVSQIFDRVADPTAAPASAQQSMPLSGTPFKCPRTARPHRQQS